MPSPLRAAIAGVLGGNISPATARRLACEGSLVTMIVKNGEPIAVGRTCARSCRVSTGCTPPHSAGRSLPGTVAASSPDAATPFISRPSRRKPIVVCECHFDEPARVLRYTRTRSLATFTDFEALLREPGPWIAGLDLPFGQSRRFIETIGWPLEWDAYVAHAASLGRQGFRDALDAYRAPRATGDKEHARRDDRAAGSVSPQKLYGVPVGLLFLEGAPRLQAAGVAIPGLQQGDPERIAIEAYPGALARHLIGRQFYKNDAIAKQAEALHQARVALLAAIRANNMRMTHGTRVVAPDRLADDQMAGELDALLCAVQACWAWTRRENEFGMPPDADRLEGWIAEATLPGRS